MQIEPSSLLLRTQSAFEQFSPPAAIAPAVQAASSDASFLQMFEGAIVSVDAKNQAASQRMSSVDAGQSDDLVGAMLASQEASLSFSMLMQVRNKVMGAVDEVIKLQV